MPPEVHDSSDSAFTLPEDFDDSVYLLERKVPKRLAIIETNKCLVDKADYIIAGVILHGGGTAFNRNKITHFDKTFIFVKHCLHTIFCGITFFFKINYKI